MTYRASGRKSASARRPVGHFTSKECAMNLGINAISLQPHIYFVEKISWPGSFLSIKKLAFEQKVKYNK